MKTYFVPVWAVSPNVLPSPPAVADHGAMPFSKPGLPISWAVVHEPAGFTVQVKLALAVAVALALSVTITVSLPVPAVVGLPLITPADEIGSPVARTSSHQRRPRRSRSCSPRCPPSRSGCRGC